MSSWACPGCTLLNAPDAPSCAVCGHAVGAGSSANGWACSACTFVNPRAQSVCQICGAQQLPPGDRDGGAGAGEAADRRTSRKRGREDKDGEEAGLAQLRALLLDLNAKADAPAQSPSPSSCPSKRQKGVDGKALLRSLTDEAVALATGLDRVRAALNELPATDELLLLLTASGLLPLLALKVRVDSLLDIEKCPDATYAALRLIATLTARPDLQSLVYLPPHHLLCDVQALQELATTAQSIMVMIAGGFGPVSGPKDDKCVRAILELTSAILSQCPAELPAATAAPQAGEYARVMANDRFAFVPDFASHAARAGGQSRTASHAPAPPALVRHLAREYAGLAAALPTSEHASIFVRASESDVRLAKALLIGPPDTPYENGAFLFDVKFPNEYPKVPPKFVFLTNGGGTVRFNPNLYEGGRVCLSLLNTWDGPRWDPQLSTFQQVLISIQGLILVPDPYFNEPGWENDRNTRRGQTASSNYNARLHPQTVRWAMLDALRAPAPEFADTVRRHFVLQRDAIQRQLAQWNVPKASVDELMRAIDKAKAQVGAQPVPATSSASSAASSGTRTSAEGAGREAAPASGRPEVIVIE